MKKKSILVFAVAAAFGTGTAFAAPSASDIAREVAGSPAQTQASSATSQRTAGTTRTSVARQDTAGTADTVSAEKARYVESMDEFKVATLHREAVSPSYRLFRGDTISMLIVGFQGDSGFGNYAATTGDATAASSADSLTIGLDGYVQLPYIGNVKMEGMTLDEAKETLTASLGQYLKIPDLSVLVTRYGPRKVYVMGQVEKPGIQQMNIDDMNAYAALASAGSWTRRARSTRIQVLRVRDNIMYYRTLDMKAYIKRHDLTQNVVLEDGDIIYVPSSNGIKFNEDVMPYISAWTLFRTLTN